MEHVFPCKAERCIVNNQPCNFFKSREKERNVVFIAAPSMNLVDLRHEITTLIEAEEVDGAEKWDCWFAADRTTSTNKISLCQKICEPMLKSAIVIVIGDWRGNQGNVNVAFEYGLATAFGCEVIPVELVQDGKGAFDFLPLEKVQVSPNWREDEKELERFREKFIGYFRKAAARAEFSGIRGELPSEVRQGIVQLIEHCETSETDEERESCQRQLLTFQQSNPTYIHQVWQEPSLVGWVVSSVKRYSEEGFTDASMRTLFFEIMEAVVVNNLHNSKSLVLSDKLFLDALKKVATAAGAPQYARTSCLNCLARMVTESGRIELLSVFSQIIDNRHDQGYDNLKMPRLIRSMSGDMIRNGTIAELLQMVRGPGGNTANAVVKRREAISQALRSA